jgi:hypothetical protein
MEQPMKIKRSARKTIRKAHPCPSVLAINS